MNRSFGAVKPNYCDICEEPELTGEPSSYLEMIEVPDYGSMWLCHDCLHDLIDQDPPEFEDVRDEFGHYMDN